VLEKTFEFPKVVQLQFSGEVDKINTFCSAFPQDVACQILLKSTHVSHIYSKNNKGDAFCNTTYSKMV